MQERHSTKIGFRFCLDLKVTLSESAEQNRAFPQNGKQQAESPISCPSIGTPTLKGNLERISIVILLFLLLISMFNSIFPTDPVTTKEAFLVILLEFVELGVSILRNR